MPRIQASEIHKNKFDFVIIGGGTAGCVLANRLSSSGKHTVLVLEAGTSTQEELLNVRIPLFNSKLKNTHVDWKLRSITHANANNRPIGVPLGKLLGGSSAFNACLLHRCSPSDYDAWNSSAWTYEQLKPYFRKAENFHDPQQQEDFADVHGTSGPLNATQINKETTLGTQFKKACKNYGLPEYHDMTDLPRQIGVTGMQASIYKGERVSAGSSYLPVDVQNERSNLFIGLGCKVTRLAIDEEKRVTHVEFTDTKEDGTIYKAVVGKEAILSAGAILSPSLLLLSGIGPEPELNKLGIQTIIDLPGVGKNLQNHWRVPLVHETPSADMSLHSDIFGKEQESLNRALESKDGALTQLWPDAVAFMKVPNAPDNSSNVDNTPQIEVFTGGLALCSELPNLTNVDCATVLMVYVTPFSKGSVTLNNDKTPRIDLGLLDDERDLECLEKGLLLSMHLANDAEYKDHCIKRWILHPGDSEDKSKIREYIKQHVDTLHHYAGTCKMGPKEDSLAVVDNHLKVHGIQGLRVVDASFFPIVPAGQICFPVIACAERASDIILLDNQL